MILIGSYSCGLLLEEQKLLRNQGSGQLFFDIGKGKEEVCPPAPAAGFGGPVPSGLARSLRW